MPDPKDNIPWGPWRPDKEGVPSTELVPVEQPDPGNDRLIDDLQDEAAPKPKRCPNCGQELPRE